MGKLLKKSLISWYNNDAFTRSAAIAYYTIFSFPALLIILTGIANLLIDENIIKTSIISYLQKIIGNQAAIETFQTVDRVNIYDNNVLILIFGVVMLLFSALRLFMQLQDALNHIWQIKTKEFEWKTLLIRRAYSFGVMVCIGFVMLVSLFITSLLTSLSEWMTENISDYLKIGFFVINFVLSLATISFLFALIIRMLPDKNVAWSTAFTGGTIAAFLFMIGQYALSFYFGIAKPESAYGVSGSIILLMLWVSYSVLILLYGAEFSKAYSDYKYKQKLERA